MKKINILNRLLVACFLTAVSLSPAAQADTPGSLPDNVPGLLVLANKAYTDGDYVTYRNALESLHDKRPYNSEYMYQLVTAYALLDQKSNAYDLMLRMQKQGLSYDFSATDNTLNIRGTEVFDYVSDLMIAAGEPMGASEPVFTLPDNVLKPEAISWDESRQKFLVGTITTGSIFAVSKDGQVSELLSANSENGLWAIFDILVDQAGNRLWVSSAAVPGFENFDLIDKGRSALFEFNLETLELIHRYPVPVDGQSHILGNMVLSSKGDIFIVDRALPLVYTKPAGEAKLKPLVILKQMVSMRGIAIQPDGRIMYVADREMGITVVDIQGGRAQLLALPETLNAGGIDGMYLDDNRLVIIQNGIRPQRLMRLQLDPSGTKVSGVRPLAVAQPEFDFPNFGTLQDEDIYYFANSHSAGGANAAKPVTVLRTPLDSNEDLVSPEMQQFLKKQAGKSQEQPREEGNN